MKPNPYVYPYTPFENLANKNIRQNFVDQKNITIAELKEIIDRIPVSRPRIEGGTTAEKILSIFQDENYRFGPAEYIEENQNLWIEKLNYFINQSQPIQLTILGFPFKIPVPLKTNRVLPDLGEVLSLARLKTVIDIIKDIYPPGATVTIFTEGAFGQFTGVPRPDWIAYREFLEALNKWLAFSPALKIVDLSEMEKTVPDFIERHRQRTLEFKKLYRQQDPEFLKKYQGTFESVLRIVSTKGYDESLLLDVYNEGLKDEEISAEAREIRRDIKSRAHESIFQYHAYLKVRDDIDYLARAVPHALPLTVSPKPNRLGIIPVNKECIRLPYHGVPVCYPKKNLFLIEYLIDIKRRPLDYTLVYFDQDRENKPFYYIAHD
ncbi:MAG: L-tyrosine/L-tryptophan isonitrile synthase family protein [Candidatus Nealsonbacteria bacterium]|nr:L-tyrosine/L-tryptophan isonitrile synthase family protein [Candidatus Nealsonbacteria bacterium]